MNECMRLSIVNGISSANLVMLVNCTKIVTNPKAYSSHVTGVSGHVTSDLMNRTCHVIHLACAIRYYGNHVIQLIIWRSHDARDSVT